jgi:hypothetical protein
MGSALLVPDHQSKIGLADPSGLLQNGIEYGLQLTRRTGNDVQYLELAVCCSSAAASCSRASFSSRVSRAISAPCPSSEELPRVTGAVRRFDALALRLPAFAGLLLALERRRIAHPKLRTTPIFKVRLHQGFAAGEMGFNDKFAQS